MLSFVENDNMLSNSAVTPVHLYVTDTQADWEVGHAIAHIANPEWQRTPGRYEVVTVGATAAPITTMGGVRIVPDITVDELDPTASAMLLLPGAQTWDDVDAHAGILATLDELLAVGTPVAAICGATGALAAAGVLDDRSHTSNALEYLQLFPRYAGAGCYVDGARAVTDQGVITAAAMFPVDFARHVLAALEVYEPEVLDAWYGLYTSGDPSHYAVLSAA